MVVAIKRNALPWLSLSAVVVVLDQLSKLWVLRSLPEFPEMAPIHEEKHVGALAGVIDEWEPENPQFWNEKGRAIARRNLWLSVPALLLAFVIWMVWSVVVAKLPSIGFKLTTDQLFWLAAMPGLSGATLRIFYSFMPPIFGGRLWTAVSTWSLMIPAVGIGLAVQSPDTPYIILLSLALLCGFGGGNFASSMANISFFFPKAEKGTALALNAGLGNLGVSVGQFVIPLVITSGVFGWLGGEPQQASEGTKLWLQNAGFIWVPFIAASAIAAWFGMNDIAAMKASFADQAVIFKRKHNWVMCLLYTGTFGSFIGYSAAMPLLVKTQFPGITANVAFIGPLVGSLFRPLGGLLADRVGGARVTVWNFIDMGAGVLGVLAALDADSFGLFLTSMLVLFATSGVGNGSTYRMIPAIFRAKSDNLVAARHEAAAVIGLVSAIGALGGFLIPRAFGMSIAQTGSIDAALYGFLIFYVACVGTTWLLYLRRSLFASRMPSLAEARV